MWFYIVETVLFTVFLVLVKSCKLGKEKANSVFIRSIVLAAAVVAGHYIIDWLWGNLMYMVYQNEPLYFGVCVLKDLIAVFIPFTTLFVMAKWLGIHQKMRWVWIVTAFVTLCSLVQSVLQAKYMRDDLTAIELLGGMPIYSALGMMDKMLFFSNIKMVLQFVPSVILIIYYVILNKDAGKDRKSVEDDCD